MQRFDDCPDPQSRGISLAEVPPGSVARIRSLEGDAAFRDRLRTMGLREGQEIEIIKQAPLADPREYRIGCIHLSLRQEQAGRIGVECVRRCPGCGRRWRWGRRRCGG